MLKRTLIAAAVASLPFAALAQTSTTSTSATTSSTSTSTSSTQTVPTSRLVTEYTNLAGSQKNAQSLVTGLRTGSQITLTDSSGKTTTFTPPTKPMGNGNVNITLRIAQQMMANNSSLTLQQALMGTSTQQGILQMRASGMGWGQIAKAEGFKLGEVMRPVKPERASKEVREAREDSKPEKADRVARVERPEKVERVERVERPQRPDRPERPGR